MNLNCLTITKLVKRLITQKRKLNKENHQLKEINNKINQENTNLEINMALTKDELTKVLNYVKSLQETNASDESQISDLKTQVTQFQADHDLVNDPDLVAAFDAVVNNAANAPVPVSAPAPVDPGVPTPVAPVDAAPVASVTPDPAPVVAPVEPAPVVPDPSTPVDPTPAPSDTPAS